MTDDMIDKPDPVDAAQDFADEIDYVALERENKLRDLGLWLVAEARWKLDVALRNALHENERNVELNDRLRAHRVATADMAEALRAAHAGATPDYVHDESHAIEDPADFLAWLFSLDAAGRLDVAKRVLRQANEAGACFYEDHRGRIETLENQVKLLRRDPVAYGQTAPLRPEKTLGTVLGEMRREQIADLNYPETT